MSWVSALQAACQPFPSYTMASPSPTNQYRTLDVISSPTRSTLWTTVPRTPNIISSPALSGAQAEGLHTVPRTPSIGSFPSLDSQIRNRFRNPFMNAVARPAAAVFDNCPDDVLREILQHVGGFPASKRSLALLLPTLSVSKRFHVCLCCYVHGSFR
jgi:hypothetical protein